MLHLQSETTDRWLAQVDDDLGAMLVDHAHCERKAAGAAMSLIHSYVECEPICRELAPIVTEELEHFEMVLDLLKARGIPFRRLKPGGYGRKLNELVRKLEPERAVDRLLVAGLIEARSCERFSLLAEHIRAREPELAEFYASLFESEARHHAVYTRLAEEFAAADVVAARLDELYAAEAAIIDEGDPLPRMHS